jgi:hypothetical protein
MATAGGLMPNKRGGNIPAARAFRFTAGHEHAHARRARKLAAVSGAITLHSNTKHQKGSDAGRAPSGARQPSTATGGPEQWAAPDNR